jgi:protein phosphatase
MVVSGSETLQFSAISDRGRLRSGNEDACGHDAALGLFVVCDGMGGAAAGEVASRMAVQSILEYWRKAVGAKDDSDKPAETTDTKSKSHRKIADAAGSEDSDSIRVRLRAAIQEANDRILRRASRDAKLHGMGTTALAMYVQHVDEKTRVWLAHVGDSRCYRWRQGNIHQLTMDHSLVEEQVRLGHLTAEQAEQSPFRNVITRAVGATESLDTDVHTELASAGDIYLLCTDGLTRELDEARIASIISAHVQTDSKKPMETACEELVQAANEHGGRDNITCILVRVG